MTTVPLAFPHDARFAFTVVDDTDNSTVANVRPVYDLLTTLGMRVTKTVWVYPPRDAYTGGCLLEPDYLAFVQALQRAGHEIGLHNVGSGEFTREEILRGLELFRERLGHYPRVHVNHDSNADNLYWRPERRFRPPASWAYAAATLAMAYALGRARTVSDGDDPTSPHYWGDAARAHVHYVRNLTFRELNTLRVDPRMPYHDPRKPDVRAWFSSADAHTVDHFMDLTRPANVEQLEAERGVAVLYTHFTDGFTTNGVVHAGFAERMRWLATRPGWFAPASEVLDLLSQGDGRREVTQSYLRRLELRWFGQRVHNYVRYRR